MLFSCHIILNIKLLIKSTFSLCEGLLFWLFSFHNLSKCISWNSTILSCQKIGCSNRNRHFCCKVNLSKCMSWNNTILSCQKIGCQIEIGAFVVRSTSQNVCLCSEFVESISNVSELCKGYLLTKAPWLVGYRSSKVCRFWPILILKNVIF